MIRRVASLAFAGFLQLVRSRVYLNILVAGIGLVLAARAFDELSANSGGRVLFNVGLAFIALVVAALAGVVAITALARELETKQAHLLLARPLGPAEFVVARFLTTAMLVTVSNAALGGILACTLALTGASHAGLAFGAALFASFEGFIVAGIAMFFGVGSSSTVSAVFTTTIFILGRLTGDMLQLIERGKFGDATPLFRVIYGALPHLSAFDLTPLAYAPIPATSIAQAAVYGCSYALALVLLAAWRFSRRDLL